MMKISTIAFASMLVAASVFSAVNAQTMTTMPTFYNTSGTAVNSTSGTALPAGWYYTSPGGSQVYYYGNGTYYDPSTGTYGGSVSNPNGTAGASISSTGTGTYTGTSGSGTYTGTVTTPGVPNTGVGGNAGVTWAVLLSAGLVAIAGAATLIRRNAIS